MVITVRRAVLSEVLRFIEASQTTAEADTAAAAAATAKEDDELPLEELVSVGMPLTIPLPPLLVLCTLDTDRVTGLVPAKDVSTMWCTGEGDRDSRQEESPPSEEEGEEQGGWRLLRLLLLLLLWALLLLLVPALLLPLLFMLPFWLL